MQSIAKVLRDLHAKHKMEPGTEIKSWPEEMKKELLGAMTYFMREPRVGFNAAVAQLRLEQAEKRAFLAGKKGATSLDMTPVGAVIDPLQIEKYHTGVDDVDLGYEPLFGFVDMRSSSNSSFKINDVSSGLTWRQVKPGEAVKIDSPGDRSNALTVEYIKWGAAIGFLDEWFRFQHFWEVEDTLLEFRAKYYMEKASLHYKLLATSVTAQAFDTNIVTTINNACAAILRACKQQGYALGSNPQFDILCPPELLQTIGVALDTASNMYARVDQKGKLSFNIRNVISSMNYCDSTGAEVKNKFDVVLPERKLKRADWQDVKTESKRDALTSSEDMVGTAMFNCGKGNAHQTRRCAIS